MLHPVDFGRVMIRISVMQHKRMMIGAATVMALVAGSISPAMARGNRPYSGPYNGGYYGDGHGGGYGDGYRGHRHHRDRDGVSAGTVIGIAAVLGAVAIIAASASKSTKERRNGPYSGSGSTPGDSRYDDRADPYGSNDETAAVNDCAVAAEDKAAQNGGYAQVVEMGTPRQTRDGWTVDGSVEHRTSYNARSGETRRFSCAVRDGRVAEVILSRRAT
jgi:hypothetical protein